VSDYLTALVQRARGEATALRPQLRSRFSGEAAPVEMDQEVEAARPAAETAPPIAERRAAGPASAVRVAGDPAASQRAPGRAAAKRGAASGEVHVRHERAVEAGPRGREERAASAAPPEPTAAPPELEPHAEAKPPPAERPPPPPLVVTERVVERDVEHHIEHPGERVLRAEPEPEPVPPYAPPRPPEGSAETPRLPPPSPAAVAPPTLKEAAPSVAITIGRVELRAPPQTATAPPPPARPKWGGPALPLEDYLRGRR
jgi:hypothetical protein